MIQKRRQKVIFLSFPNLFVALNWLAPLTNLDPLGDAIVFRVDSAGVLRVCSVTGAGNQGGWGVERVAEVDALLKKIIPDNKR